MHFKIIWVICINLTVYVLVAVKVVFAIDEVEIFIYFAPYII